ncbi:hypothetical protein [uncultured Anaerococcus sp.]|uniref:hypothetical protein n=1 Tax=uncultured Anaerococcus sp. TaxID=293428 RepID=UPI00280A5118|nr:hypothetical protein [uncultured Anaerococcus sp.]
MEYLIILMFLAFAIYNLRESKGKEIRIDISPIYKIILVAAGILYLVLAYKIGGGIESGIAAIFALFYLCTTIYCQGIGKDGFYVLLGKSTIRKIAFSNIKNIKVDKENYKLEIYADSTIYKQKYKKEDFPQVLKIIENLK